jgi:hypothetical protein
LLNDAGIGLLSNNDYAGDEFESSIPPGAFSGESGQYRVAISNYDNYPVSEGGRTFPDGPRTEVLEPTSSGSQSTVTSWSQTGVSREFGDYRIEFTGATVVVFIEPSFGDVNGDSHIDVDDLDSLFEVLASAIPIEVSDVCVQHPPEDVNVDGFVNYEDVTSWLSFAALHNGFAAPFLPGDSNLDGMVNRTDLNVLAVNWLGETTKWSAGDFTAEGNVNAADLNELAQNWQQAIPMVSAANAPVPEPSALLLIAVGVVLLSGGRKLTANHRVLWC